MDLIASDILNYTILVSIKDRIGFRVLYRSPDLPSAVIKSANIYSNYGYPRHALNGYTRPVLEAIQSRCGRNVCRDTSRYVVGMQSRSKRDSDAIQTQFRRDSDAIQTQLRGVSSMDRAAAFKKLQ